MRLHAGQTQVFGTQLTMRAGELKPLPLIDEENVDHRRALIGLPPLAEYIAVARGMRAEQETKWGMAR